MSNNGMFEIFLEKAGSIPGVRIDREEFLRSTFKRKVRNNKSLEKIIEKGPVEAGVSMQAIGEIADKVIKSEASVTSAISFVTGIPGGAFMLGTIPADMLQFYAHVFIVVQKLMYLYGWEEDIFDCDGNLDPETESAIIVFIGAMFGVNTAGVLLKTVSTTYAKKGVTKAVWNLALKSVKNVALRKSMARVIKMIGIKSIPKVTKGAVKAVPILGGAISGAITYPSFIISAKRLKKYFENGDINGFEFEEDEEEIKED